MDIQQIFDEVAKKMVSDFEEAKKVFTHPGLKGTSHENSVRTFLEKYLPKSIDLSTGTIIDSLGNMSRQLDVIISDSKKTPIFFSSGEIRVVPVECVYSVIEVKTYVDKTELERIYINLESVKKLKKTAYYPEKMIVYNVNLYGKDWPIWPMNYFVFAYDSIELGTLAKHISDLNRVFA